MKVFSRKLAVAFWGEKDDEEIKANEDCDGQEIALVNGEFLIIGKSGTVYPFPELLVMFVAEDKEPDLSIKWIMSKQKFEEEKLKNVNENFKKAIDDCDGNEIQYNHDIGYYCVGKNGKKYSIPMAIVERFCIKSSISEAS